MVALAIPWLSLLVTLEPLFTCGPAPRILCSTLKAFASALPATPPSLVISECTRSSLFCTRSSPTRKNTDTHTHTQQRHATNALTGLQEEAERANEVLPPRYTAFTTGAPAPRRTLRSPSPICLRTECFTPESRDRRKRTLWHQPTAAHKQR